MAATLSIEQNIEIGESQHLYFGTIALDSSYPTGGEAIDVTGNESFDYLFAQQGGYVFSWDRANQKLLAYWNGDATPAALPQVTATTDLSALTAIPFFAIGS